MSNIHDNHNYSGSKVRDAGDFLLQLTYAYTRQAKDSPVAGAFILQDDSEQQNEQPIVSKKQKFLIFDPPLGSKEPGSAYILFFLSSVQMECHFYLHQVENCVSLQFCQRKPGAYDKTFSKKQSGICSG